MKELAVCVPMASSWKLHRQNQTLEPRPIPGQHKRCITDDQLPEFLAQLEAHPDFTLAQHAQLWSQTHTSVSVVYSWMKVLFLLGIVCLVLLGFVVYRIRRKRF